MSGKKSGVYKQSLRASTVPSTKHAFDNPLTIEWPGILKSDQNEVQRILQSSHCSCIGELEKKKSLLKRANGKVKVAKKIKQKGWEELEVEELDPELVKKAKEARGYLSIGLNAVTRGIENGQVDLVLVCRDTLPSQMIDHLPILCAVKKCAIIPVNGFRKCLREVVGTPALAMGVKVKRGESGDELVKSLKPFSKMVRAEWLDCFVMGSKSKVGDKRVLQKMKVKCIHSTKMNPKAKAKEAVKGGSKGKSKEQK
eukprot:Nk52_evm37s554 gene=Nk52_evmTU37s554